MADLLRGYLLARAGDSARLRDLQESSALLGPASVGLGFFALLASGVWARTTVRLVERLGEHSAARPATTMLALGRVSALGLLATAFFAWTGQPKPSDSAATVADADLLNLIVAAVLLVGAALTSLWRVGKLLVPQPA